MKQPIQRASSHGGNEGLLRELLATQAVFASQLETIQRSLSATQEDSREARDLANRITTILEEQNLGERLTELRNDVRGEVAGLRQDVVAAHTNLKRDITDMERRFETELTGLKTRLTALENKEQQREGVKSLVGWLMKNAPWLFAGVAAFVAGVGFKEGMGK